MWSAEGCYQGKKIYVRLIIAETVTQKHLTSVIY